MSIKTNSEKDAVKFLEEAKIGVILTDTIYGLVAKANNKIAVDKLYKLKDRENKPGTLIASSVDQLVRLGVLDDNLSKAQKYWPNPISILLRTNDELDYLKLGQNLLACRVTNDSRLKSLIEKTGPLLTSSANLPGQKPASNIKEAFDYFGYKIDFYVDAGEVSDKPPSTIIKFENDNISIVRQGAMML